MTRAVSTRSSKRKQAQNPVPDDCKENAPTLLQQSLQKDPTPHNKNSSVLSTSKPKDNVPLRKSVRRNSIVVEQFKAAKTPIKVLCDRTNSSGLRLGKNVNDKNESLATVKNKRLLPVSSPNSTNLGKIDKNNSHIPVYKTVSPLVTPKRKNLPAEKKEALYDFEVDENEEPVLKKKRKKRPVLKKPKIGPKALTINNIKYGSTESLASLPEKSCPKKKSKKITKTNLKPYSSVSALNRHEDTQVSVDSFISHPPSVLLCENKEPETRHELSILRETISEDLLSPPKKDDLLSTVTNSMLSKENNQPEITDELSYSHETFSRDFQRSEEVGQSAFDPNPPQNHTILAKSNVNSDPSIHHNVFSPNPRCYSSKSCRTPNPNSLENSYSAANITFPHQVSSCSNNVSRTSHDFLSSTPCKRSSLVVRNNSVFDESTNSNALRFRPSTGYIQDNVSISNNQTDNCFGFNEPEEVEEPLVSPIKASIDLVEPRRRRVASLRLNRDEPQSKPSAQEVIEMLKATIPDTERCSSNQEITEAFETSQETNNSALTTAFEENEASAFIKPPRRSYERQRRIKWSSDHEESDDEEESAPVEEKQPPPKEVKKCYKKNNKANTTKTAKVPKPTKAKQKLAKEEEELERLAAQMNAQFQEIDKVSLVVE